MKNEKAPAFPQMIEMGDGERIGYFGLTKLEVFTKEAMAELIHIADKRGWTYQKPEGAEEVIGKKAVLIAKATLAALEAE